MRTAAALILGLAMPAVATPGVGRADPRPEGRSLQRLIGDLRSKDDARRIAAAEALGEMGREAVPAMTALCIVIRGDTNPQARSAAARVVADVVRFEPDSASTAVPALRWALRTGSERIAAASRPAKARPAVRPVKMTAAARDAERARDAAAAALPDIIAALGRIGTDARPAAPDLLAVLKTHAAGRRDLAEAAVKALGWVEPGHPQAAAELSRLAREGDPAVREWAAALRAELGEMARRPGDPRDETAAKVSLIASRLRLSEPFFRRAACRDLAKLRADAEPALPALRERMADDDPGVASAAAEAVAAIERACEARRAATPPPDRIE